MKNILPLILAGFSMASCVASTESAVYSFNGKTVEMELYGDTFAYGTPEQQQAQIEAARVKAAEVCGGEAVFLSRRLVHQPQNGLYFVPAKDIALFRCF